MSDEVGKNLGGNVASRRKALGLTQDYIAQRLGVEIETVSRIERGVTLPSLRTLSALAHELSSSVQALLGEEPTQSEKSDLEGMVLMVSKLDEADRAYVVGATKALCKHLLGNS